MMQIINCLFCGGPISMLNKVAVIVQYKSYERYCSHCNNMKDTTKTNNFCSIKCFEDYYIHDTQRVEPKRLTEF